MSVYKRGEKAVYYMNFTVAGVRVTRSTGKFTKREAKIVWSYREEEDDGRRCSIPQGEDS